MSDNITPAEWDSIGKKDPHNKRNMTVKHIEDSIESPQHYNKGSMECIDAIEGMLTREEYIGYLRGNSLKYRWRFREKGKPVEDLRKARWYESRLLNYMMDTSSEKL